MGEKPEKPRIKIVKNGPLVVSGGVPLREKIIEREGARYVYRDGRDLPQAAEYRLCRCGKTAQSPFCDGSHGKYFFIGTETASRDAFVDRAELSEGPGLDLLDDHRCAFARFCHREDGTAWDLARRSGDERLKSEAIKAATDCPAGRLAVRDKAGELIEPHYEPEIHVLQDPERDVSGGYFVRGGIPIEGADGVEYERQNRVVLCRCGLSRNKPFCDAAHVALRFKEKGNGKNGT